VAAVCEPGVPLVRLGGLRSVVCRWARGLLACRRARTDRSPEPVDSGSSSHVQPPLQSSFVEPPALSRRRRALPARVSSLFAASPAGSTHARLATPRFVPPSGFRNLSTACSPTDSTGLFRPAATSRVSVQGLLPTRSTPDSSPGDSPLPLGGFRARGVCRSRRRSPRLRGVAPRADAFRQVGVSTFPPVAPLRGFNEPSG